MGVAIIIIRHVQSNTFHKSFTCSRMLYPVFFPQRYISNMTAINRATVRPHNSVSTPPFIDRTIEMSTNIRCVLSKNKYSRPAPVAFMASVLMTLSGKNAP